MRYITLQVHTAYGYSPAQAVEYASTLTVGELRDMLEGLDGDALVLAYDASNTAEWGVLDAVEETP